MARPAAAQRQPLELPTPTLTAPPIFTQVSVPSTLAKPGPYAAQVLPVLAPLVASSLLEVVGLSAFGRLDGSANTIEAGSSATTIKRRVLRIRPFYRL
jgi:hypothetical protein